VNHCLAQFFGVGLTANLPKRYFVRLSIIIEDQWVIHRDICSPLLKVADRIASSSHHVAQQLVGLGYGAGRSVNEARLDSAPGLYKARAIAFGERPDVKCLDPLCAPFERGFRIPTAVLLDSACVFSAAELSAQPFSAALSLHKERGNAYGENRDESDD